MWQYCFFQMTQVRIYYWKYSVFYTYIYFWHYQLSLCILFMINVCIIPSISQSALSSSQMQGKLPETQRHVCISLTVHRDLNMFKSTTSSSLQVSGTLKCNITPIDTDILHLVLSSRGFQKEVLALTSNPAQFPKMQSHFQIK